jgi:sugar lactone lactonase YvrE
MRPTLLSALFLLSFLALPALAARALPPADPRLDAAACSRIPTGPGPHSLLPLPGSTRLLISSHDRRAFEKPGELYAYDTTASRLLRLPRSGDPKGLVLRPHHMDIVKRGDETLLYLINHDEGTPNSTRHSILVYAVQDDRLVFRQRFTDPLLSSPNHLSVAPDGDIYVTNDRRDGSSVMELLLRQKKATLVHFREGRGWRIAAEGMSFPNGVEAEDERVMVVKTFGNEMITWPRYEDGTLGPRQSLLSLPQLDGLNPGPEPGTWLTVSHGGLVDFMRHKGSSGHASPATIYLVNPAARTYTPFFADDGRRISAMSNAVLAHKALWIGQSFDSFILRCPLR